MTNSLTIGKNMKLRTEARMLSSAMSVGDRLRWLMEVRCITQIRLAQLVGVKQSAISNVVTNNSRKPSAPTLLRICDALDCNPAWILNGEGEPFQRPQSAAAKELMQLFERMSREAQAAILSVARSMAQAR